jgi:eukaryotic-like serine/threonine-protein kinase
MNSALDSEPSHGMSLASDQQSRLAQILDEYLRSLEGPVPLRPDELLARYPEFRNCLEEYLPGLDLLQHAAVGFVGQVTSPFAEPRGSGLDELSLEPETASCDVGADTMGHADRPGRLGDFQLLREIGRGGMGVVYAARQISLDRQVALKLLPFAAVLDAKQVTRFKHEAQAAAQLHHPNIVPVFAIGAERGIHYYAMHYVDGQPLDEVIRQLRQQAKGGSRQQSRWQRMDGSHRSAQDDASLPGASPPGDSTNRWSLTEHSTETRGFFRFVARLGVQAARALHAAHEAGIVHRDVKPSNLLLDAEGKLWVTDFGLARIRSDPHLTRTGELVGTMRYMSPEQAFGRSIEVDHRSDIYSLGATLYELMTLCRVVRGEQGPELLRQLERDPRRPRALNPRVPADLENIVLKSLERHRDGRYASAAEMADDLQRFLDGLPTRARPLSLSQRVAKWGRRHQRFVAVSACFMLLATCLTTACSLWVLRENAQKEQALQQARENLALADANFRAAREAVDHFGAQVAERLADVPAAQQTRQALLLDTLRYYQRFVAQSTDDRTLLKDIAVTHAKIGDLSERTGQTLQAIAAYQQAEELFARVAAAIPAHRDHVAQLALCRNNLGLLLARRGDTQRARELFLQAASAQQTLASEANEPPHAVDLARTQNNLGWLCEEVGEFEQAERYYLAALDVQQRQAADDPQDVRTLRDLAATLNNLSMLYSDRDIEAAIRHAQAAFRIHAQLAKRAAEPGWEKQGKRHERLHEQALAESNLAALYARVASPDRAIVSYEHAVAALSELAEEAPHEQRYRSDLALSLNNLGLLRCRLNEHAAAIASFERALGFQQQLVEETPENPDSLSRLGGIQNNLGTVHWKRSDVPRATAAFSSAIRYQQQAVELAPHVERFRVFLARHQTNLQRLESGADPAVETSPPEVSETVAAPVVHLDTEYRHESPREKLSAGG